MEQKALILDEKAMGRAIARISFEIIERNKGVDNLCLIGILSRGGQLARRIADKIKSVEDREDVYKRQVIFRALASSGLPR